MLKAILKKLALSFLVFLFPVFVLAQTNSIFFVDKTYDYQERQNIRAQKIFESQLLSVWIEESFWFSRSESEKQNILSFLNKVSLSFENRIYPQLRSLFGSEWSPGIDNDPRIYLLFHRTKPGVSAYFNSKDEYLKLQDPTSNEHEMVYVSTDLIGKDTLEPVLAHELLHLISFNQKTRKLGKVEEVWLEEARGEIAVYLVFSQDLLDRKRRFIVYPEDSLTEWKNKSPDYAVVYIFSRYLLERFGPVLFTKTLNYPERGIDAINRYLKEKGRDETFSSVFANFLIALYLGDCTNSDNYCFLSDDLKNLRVVPNITFLPSASESTLVLQKQTKDWTPSWQKFVGRVKNLKVRFTANPPVQFIVPYVLERKDGRYEIGFMNLADKREGEMVIKNFGESYKALVLMPFSITKTRYFSPDEPVRTYRLVLEGFTREKPSSADPSGPTDLVQRLLAEIERLKKELARLQEELARLKNKKTPSLSCQITENLYYGVRGPQVRCLQEFLRNQGPEIYPEGLVTGYFGPLTLQAVKRFQLKYKDEILSPLGLTEPTGFVGPMTRRKIEEINK